MRHLHQELVTYTCSIIGCKFMTNSKRSLNRHLKRHIDGKPVVRGNQRRRCLIPCSFPNCKFSTKRPCRMREHIHRWHNPNPVKEFSCSFCPKTFYSQSNANLHLSRIHLKEKGYQCEKCSYATAYLMELKYHQQRTHDESFGASGFACKLCGFRALTKRGLTTHMRVHPEERKFQLAPNSFKLLQKCRENSSPPTRPVFRKIPVVLLDRFDIQVL